MAEFLHKLKTMLRQNEDEEIQQLFILYLEPSQTFSRVANRQQ